MSNEVKHLPDAPPSTPTDTPAGGGDPASRTGRHRSLGQLFSVRNIGAIYTWIVIIILFAILAPSTFPTVQTAKSILNEYAITGLVALALVVPLAAGVYDLSIGYMVGFSGVMVAHLLAITSLSPVVAGLITMVVCLALGCVNAFVIVVLRVNSFIATLGTGALISALATALSGDAVITGRVGGSFTKLATVNLSTISLPVFYMLVAMVAIGYWLERTGSGRRMYAVGFDPEAARLAGLRVNRAMTISLIFSASLAGFAGLVLAANVASGSPDVGPEYLIPAFSAAFLGATQLRSGRFNPWGTVIGVLLIGTGNVGLILSGGPQWTTELFEGLVLIVAVAASGADRQAILARIRSARTAMGRSTAARNDAGGTAP